MPHDSLRTTSLTEAEDGLIGYVRLHAELSEDAYRGTDGWSHPTPFHLLLALGRRFTPVPSPNDLTGMPARHCYSNAARYALAHRDDGLVYAEGFALTQVGSTVYLPHAWVVRPDGTVLDPTWHDMPGRAYIGIPVADSRLWPVEGGGLLQDFPRNLHLLRDGFPRNSVADRGRAL